MRSMLNYFSRESMGRGSQDKCHCTARFIKKGDTPITAEEEEMLGRASDLVITALIITPRTFGARVQLSPAQLTVYSQNDEEVEVVGGPNKAPHKPRPQKTSNSVECATTREAISVCNPTLCITRDKTEECVVGGGRR